MKTIKNDYCIKLFTTVDAIRPKLSKVHLQYGHLYATNKYLAAKVKADMCMGEYSPIDGYPDAEKLISEHVSVECKMVDVFTLLEDFMNLDCSFTPKLVECDKCHGDGELICGHCNAKHDCKECSGNGEKATKEIELTSEDNCNLFGREYRLQHLELIVRTAVYTGVDEIEISNARPFQGTLFTVGNFTILLIPLHKI